MSMFVIVLSLLGFVQYGKMAMFDAWVPEPTDDDICESLFNCSLMGKGRDEHGHGHGARDPVIVLHNVPSPFSKNTQKNNPLSLSYPTNPQPTLSTLANGRHTQHSNAPTSPTSAPPSPSPSSPSSSRSSSASSTPSPPIERSGTTSSASRWRRPASWPPLSC